MAFNLDGVIQKELITDVMIPSIRNNLVAANFVRTKIVMGAESIKIWGVGTVTVGDYAGGTVAGTAHTDTSVVLTLDKAKYFKENIEKIDNAQAAVDILTPVLQEGAYGIASQIDKDTFTELANTTTSVAANTAADETNIVATILAMKTALTNAGAPMEGRRLAISPEVSAILAEANLTLNTGSAEEATRNGWVGKFGGFDIYETVNLPDGATTGKICIASVERGGCLGVGFNELKAEEVSGQFFWAAMGLSNYGNQLVKNEYVVKCDITPA